MARLFNGTTDRIKLAPGGAPAGIAGTIAVIARPTSITQGQLVNAGDGVTHDWEFSIGAGNNGALHAWNDAVDFYSPTTAYVVANEWQLFAYCKASGSALPRWHQYRYSTGVWTHGSDATARADGSVTVTEVDIGGSPIFADAFPGDIAIVGLWADVLADQDIESLAFSLLPWFAHTPRGLWLLDQDKTTQKVVDFSGGGANEAVLTGTSISTNSVPVFNYGTEIWLPSIGTGAVVVAQSRAQENPIARMYSRGGQLRALALSLIYPPRQNSTLTSAVSSVAGMVIEALGGIFTTASEPIDAGQGVATTSQEPVEAAGGVASTGSLPLDEPGAIAATGVEPIESVQAVTPATGSEPVEASQGVSTTGSTPLDATGGVATTASEPIDSAQGVSSSISAPIESQMAVNVTVVLTVEALGGLSTSSSAPLDEAGGIASTSLAPLEALGGVASTGSEPYESDGSPVTVVSQTGVVVLDALGGIQATAVMPAEALGGVATPDSVPLESNQAVSSSGSFPIDAQLALNAALASVIEALAGVARATGIPLDEAGGVANTGPAPVESIQPLSTTAGIVLEAAKAVAAVAVTFPFEALLGAAAAISLPIEGFGVIIHWHYGSGTTVTYDSDGNWTYHSDDTATYDTEEDGQ